MRRQRWTALRQCSPDPEYGPKETHLLACLHQAASDPTAVALVFLDEMGYYRWPDAAAVWSARAPQPAATTDPAGTNKQWRVIGALNALTGQVEYLENYVVGRRQVIQFYRQLDQRYAQRSGCTWCKTTGRSISTPTCWPH